MAPGLIHHYFRTTDDLIAATFGRLAALEHAALQERISNLPPCAALATHVSSHLAVSEGDARLWMSAWVAAPQRPELAAEVDKWMLAGLEMLADLLNQGKQSGDFTIDDGRASAYRILVLLDGIVVQLSMRAAHYFGDIDPVVWVAVEHEVGLEPGTLQALLPAAKRRTRRNAGRRASASR